jgi:hypothetical protein
MAPSLASERAVVPAPLLLDATGIGWTDLPPPEALTLRRGESGTLSGTPVSAEGCSTSRRPSPPPAA